MRLHRFFISNRLKGLSRVIITDSDLIHQWKRVFRFKKGDQVMLLDNSGYEFVAQIDKFRDGTAEFDIFGEAWNTNIPVRKVTLYLAIIKKDKFEWVLEKGTEIGVNKFVPILSSRAEKKSINIGRAKKILKEASEQSERGVIPEILETIKLGEINPEKPSIALDPRGEKLNEEHFSRDDIEVFVGPEGGWSDEEIDFFAQKNIPILRLGRQILRSETAAIAISSLLLLDTF